MSLRLKINVVLLIIGLVTSLATITFNYIGARNRIFEEAHEKAELISSYAMASREYTKTTLRPLTVKLAGKESFHPESMAGFFVVRAIADIFAKQQEGFAFKQATLNPIVPQNKANAQEKEIIDFFSKNRSTKIKKGTLSKNDSSFFYVARPVVNKKNCNKCHGRREDAPKAQLAKYRGMGGYGWKAGDVVATLITYVPIETALSELRATTLKSIIFSLLSIALIMLSISYFMNRFIIKPIVNLTEIANEMSRGKELDKPITGTSSDEIGALCESFNRMRVSVVKLIKMVRQKKS